MANVNVQSYFLVHEHSQNSGRVHTSRKDSYINFTKIQFEILEFKNSTNMRLFHKLFFASRIHIYLQNA